MLQKLQLYLMLCLLRSTTIPPTLKMLYFSLHAGNTSDPIVLAITLRFNNKKRGNDANSRAFFYNNIWVLSSFCCNSRGCKIIIPPTLKMLNFSLHAGNTSDPIVLAITLRFNNKKRGNDANSRVFFYNNIWVLSSFCCNSRGCKIICISTVSVITCLETANLFLKAKNNFNPRYCKLCSFRPG